MNSAKRQVASLLGFGLATTVLGVSIAPSVAAETCAAPVRVIHLESDVEIPISVLAMIRDQVGQECASDKYMRTIGGVVEAAVVSAGIRPRAISIGEPKIIGSNQSYTVTVDVSAATANGFNTAVALRDQILPKMINFGEVIGTPVEREILVFRYVIDGDVAANSDMRLGLRWLRDGMPIAGASTSRYRLDRADIGANISVELTLFDGSGTVVETLRTEPTALVAEAEYPPELRDLEILGEPETGSQLAASYVFIDDNADDVEGATEFIWLRDNYAIAGAEGRIYEPTTQDIGKVIGLRIIPRSADGVAGAARTVTMRQPVKAKPVTIDPQLLDQTPSIIVEVKPATDAPVAETVEVAVPKSAPKLPSLPKSSPIRTGQKLAEVIIRALDKPSEDVSVDEAPVAEIVPETGTETGAEIAAVDELVPEDTPSITVKPLDEAEIVEETVEEIVPEIVPEILRAPDILLAEGLALDPNETTILRSVDFTRSSVFSREELAEFAREFIGRDINVELIRDIVDRMSEHYIAAEYELSRALVPEQRIVNGALALRLVEARIGQITLEEIDRLSPRFIKEFLEIGEGDLLSLSRLERSIRLFNATNKSNLTSELAPGENFGETDVFLTVQEPELVELPTLSINNYASEVTDWRQQAFSVTLNNVMRLDDEISISHNDSNGSETSAITISAPIGMRGMNWSYGHSEGNTKYTNDGAGASGIVGTRGASHSDSLGISAPIIFDDDYSIYASATAVSSYSEVTLANSEVNLNESRINKLVLSLPMNYGSALSNLSFVPSFVALNPSTKSPAFDSRSEKWMQLFKADISGSRYLNKYATLNLRSNIVYTDAIDMLNYPSELLSVGGPGSVRAYQPGVSTGHQAYFLSAELRSDLANWEGVTLPELVPYVQPYVFIDHAFAQSRQAKTQRDNFWSGAGVGISVPSIGNIFSFDAYWATPLDRNVHETQKEAYEDELFQFSLSAKFKLP